MLPLMKGQGDHENVRGNVMEEVTWDMGFKMFLKSWEFVPNIKNQIKAMTCAGCS